MKCHKVDHRVSAYLDGRLPKGERQAVGFHLESCSRCASRLNELRAVRRSLRALARPRVPPHLHTGLQVMASRESARFCSRITLGARISTLWEGFRLWRENLMRPLALPFAGGLVSAVMVFSMFIPAYSPSHAHRADVPTLLTTPTELTTETGLLSFHAFGALDDEIVIDLLVDEQGRMLDYSVPPGQRSLSNPEIRKSLENTLLFTRFTPATLFGIAAPGKTRITLRRSHMDVKG
jgi:hypothetical protein